MIVFMTNSVAAKIYFCCTVWTFKWLNYILLWYVYGQGFVSPNISEWKYIRCNRMGSVTSRLAWICYTFSVNVSAVNASKEF